MYRVALAPAAERQLSKFNRTEAKRIIRRLARLEEEPRPSGCKKLAGVANLYRIRSGVWRMVYRIDDSKRAVEVVHIGHRSDVYRAL